MPHLSGEVSKLVQLSVLKTVVWVGDFCVVLFLVKIAIWISVPSFLETFKKLNLEIEVICKNQIAQQILSPVSTQR